MSEPLLRTALDNALDNALSDARGATLVHGPSGAGKSTALAGALVRLGTAHVALFCRLAWSADEHALAALLALGDLAPAQRAAYGGWTAPVSLDDYLDNLPAFRRPEPPPRAPLADAFAAFGARGVALVLEDAHKLAVGQRATFAAAWRAACPSRLILIATGTGWLDVLPEARAVAVAPLAS